jgi:putative FmdB family regulatory protein
MPTYDYKCDACGNQFERFQSITAAPIRKCPSCGKNKVRRLIGPGAGLIFKGSGFYITDYRSEGYKDAAKKGEAKPDSSSTSTEAKPAAATSAMESKPATDSKSATKKKNDAKKP